MNGLFQLHTERENKSQFGDTMEALRVYASMAYKRDVKLLNILFSELKEPSMKKPSEPEETMKIDKGKKIVTFIPKFEELAYLSKIKGRR